MMLREQPRRLPGNTSERVAAYNAGNPGNSQFKA